MKQPQADRFVVNAKGRKTAVILPIEDFEELIEDMNDLRIVAERRNEKPVSAEAFERRLKKRGAV